MIPLEPIMRHGSMLRPATARPLDLPNKANFSLPQNEANGPTPALAMAGWGAFCKTKPSSRARLEETLQQHCASLQNEAKSEFPLQRGFRKTKGTVYLAKTSVGCRTFLANVA